MILTDIAFFSFVPKETKTLILTGKRILSDKDYKEILNISKKPPDLLKKITEQLNQKKEINAANNQIEVKTNLTKEDINKLNAPSVAAKAVENKSSNNNVSDLEKDKSKEMSKNMQNLNSNVSANTTNDLNLDLDKLIMSGSENKNNNIHVNVPLYGINPLNSSPILNVNANNNLLINPFANKPHEIKDLNSLSLSGNNDPLKTLIPGGPGLNMHSPQLNSFMKDQKDLAMNNDFNNKPGSRSSNTTSSNIGLNMNINNNNNSTKISDSKNDKDKDDDDDHEDTSSIKEDFDEDFEDKADSKKMNLNLNSANSNNTLSNKTPIALSTRTSNINSKKNFSFILF